MKKYFKINLFFLLYLFYNIFFSVHIFANLDFTNFETTKEKYEKIYINGNSTKLNIAKNDLSKIEEKIKNGDKTVETQQLKIFLEKYISQLQFGTGVENAPSDSNKDDINSFFNKTEQNATINTPKIEKIVEKSDTTPYFYIYIFIILFVLMIIFINKKEIILNYLLQLKKEIEKNKNSDEEGDIRYKNVEKDEEKIEEIIEESGPIEDDTKIENEEIVNLDEDSGESSESIKLEIEELNRKIKNKDNTIQELILEKEKVLKESEILKSKMFIFIKNSIVDQNTKIEAMEGKLDDLKNTNPETKISEKDIDFILEKNENLIKENNLELLNKISLLFEQNKKEEEKSKIKDDLYQDYDKEEIEEKTFFNEIEEEEDNYNNVLNLVSDFSTDNLEEDLEKKNIEIINKDEFKEESEEEDGNQEELVEIEKKKEDKEYVYKKEYEIIVSGKSNIFLTGGAGVGKSSIVNKFLSEEGKNMNVLILAPTGTAAINVNGQTIHRFFEIYKGDSLSAENIEVLKNLDLLIIDEISMVRADLFDTLDRKMKIALGNNLPFGGKRIVLVGDLYQLPPVVTKEEMSIFEGGKYDSPYFFSAKAYKNGGFSIIELMHIFRQKDNLFIRILNNIRKGIINKEDLDILNERVSDRESNKSIYTTTENKIAESINEGKLKLLKGKRKEFKASISGKFSRDLYPTNESLLLKEGCRIICIKNDKELRWSNGSMGVIEKIGNNGLEITFDNGEKHIVPKETWENGKIIFNETKKTFERKIIGNFSQFPVKLGYAITIHKSQGKTFEDTVIDTGRGISTHGQLYVALSRATSLKGIKLKKPIMESEIIVDPRVNEFMESKMSI